MPSRDLDAVAAVQVEVDLALGMPHFDIVGISEGAGKSARVRVLAALRNSGFVLPQKRVTVSLAPANLSKEGASFDLPIALGVLAAAGKLSISSRFEIRIFAGELALTGDLRRMTALFPSRSSPAARECASSSSPPPTAARLRWSSPCASPPPTRCGRSPPGSR